MTAEIIMKIGLSLSLGLGFVGGVIMNFRYLAEVELKRERRKVRREVIVVGFPVLVLTALACMYLGNEYPAERFSTNSAGIAIASLIIYCCVAVNVKAYRLDNQDKG